MRHFILSVLPAIMIAAPAIAQNYELGDRDRLNACAEADDQACILALAEARAADNDFAAFCRESFSDMGCLVTIGMASESAFLLSEEQTSARQDRVLVQRAFSVLEAIWPGMSESSDLLHLVDGEACLELGKRNCVRQAASVVQSGSVLNNENDHISARMGARGIDIKARMEAFLLEANGVLQ